MQKPQLRFNAVNEIYCIIIRYRQRKKDIAVDLLIKKGDTKTFGIDHVSGIDIDNEKNIVTLLLYNSRRLFAKRRSLVLSPVILDLHNIEFQKQAKIHYQELDHLFWIAYYHNFEGRRIEVTFKERIELPEPPKGMFMLRKPKRAKANRRSLKGNE